MIGLKNIALVNQGKEVKGKVKGRATKTEKLTPQELKQIGNDKKTFFFIVIFPN